MKTNTKKMVTLGMLTALSIVLMMVVRFPLFPSATYLEYEPMDVPLMVAGLHYGPAAGFSVVVLSSIIQALTVSSASGWIGALMHIVSSGTLVLVSSFIYKRNKNKKTAAIAIAAGVVAMTLIMIPANLIITTNLYGVPIEVVKASLFTVTIPFNLLKAGINGILTYFVYKPVSNLLHTNEEENKEIKTVK